MNTNVKSNTIWVERYRPRKVENYLATPEFKRAVEKYIAEQDIPHLLLHGDAGSGKTTLAKLLTHNIECDVMYINASDENGIDAVRDKIKGFASSMGLHDLKIIILDEADGLTPQGQSALRNVMETFSKTTRFIMTCNYIERIIDPIQSRCQVFEIHPPALRDVGARALEILAAEGIEYEDEDVVKIVKYAYPDIRRVINELQRNTHGGKLQLDESSMAEVNYLGQVLEALKGLGVHDMEQTFTAVRKVIADANLHDFTRLYTFLYENVDELAPTDSTKRFALYSAIAEASYKDVHRVDKEIGVMALIIEILEILSQ